jgi:hypothetical protein
MKILKSLVILCATWVGSPSFAAQEFNSFSGVNFGSAIAGDFATYNVAKKELSVCQSGSIESCKKLKIDADWVVPLGEKKGLVAVKGNVASICTLGVKKSSYFADCKAATAVDFAPFATRLSNHKLLVLGLPEGAQCTYSSKSGFKCSAAQLFRDLATSRVVSGSFTGTAEQQVLRLGGGGLPAKICVGSACKDAVGLDVMSAATKIQTGKFDNSGREVIVGFNQSEFHACSAYSDDKYRTSFSCKTEALPISDAKAYIVKSLRKGRALDVVRFVPAAPSRTQTMEDAQASVSSLTAVSARASRFATAVAMQARIAAGDAEASRSGLIEAEVGGQDDAQYYPQYHAAWGADGSWFIEWWTDSLYLDWDSFDITKRFPKPGDCVAQCDIEYNMGADACDIFANQLGATVAAVGMGVGIVTLNFPLVVGSAATGATVMGAYSGSCKAKQSGNRVRCYERCGR